MSEHTATPPRPAKPAPGADRPPLLTTRPWLILGVSRSGFYRLLAAGQVPQPVTPDGVRRAWRIADLERWVERLRPRKRPAPRGTPAA
jgi:predicted DNA-binding transcriptional regulator AlpA